MLSFGVGTGDCAGWRFGAVSVLGTLQVFPTADT